MTADHPFVQTITVGPTDQPGLGGLPDDPCEGRPYPQLVAAILEGPSQSLVCQRQSRLEPMNKRVVEQAQMRIAEISRPISDLRSNFFQPIQEDPQCLPAIQDTLSRSFPKAYQDRGNSTASPAQAGQVAA